MNTADTQQETPVQEFTEADEYPFVKDIVPGSMSGAEALAYWKANGVFDVPWPQHDDIGPGKRFADSTEYVQHLRRQIETESRD